MSQWNNGYSQPSNNWNNDSGGQYENNTYYNDQSNQYVSFNEFLTQMHNPSGGVGNSPSVNNGQYQAYVNQATYQDIPTTSQDAAQLGYYGPSGSNSHNDMNSYQNTQEGNVIASNSNTQNSDVAIKSNLTATALEFVPKNFANKPVSNPKTSVKSFARNNEGNENKNLKSNSSDSNWRERPKPSHSNGHSSQHKYDYDPDKNRKNYRGHDGNRPQENYRNQESRSQDIKTHESHRHQENYRNQESRSQDIKTHESHRSQENYRNQESRFQDNVKTHDNYTNQENGGRLRDPNYKNGNNSAKNSKYNSKFKSKEPDQARTFYNSSAKHINHDVRSSRGDNSSRNKSVGGSQRLRSMDHTSADDEIYAKGYLHYKDDRNEKNSKLDSPRKKKIVKQESNLELTQRERLSEQLDKGTLECLVCCERIKQIDPVWSCGNCYHVLHLRCIRKWAISSMVESKWRCPACQNTSAVLPAEYVCLCGAVRAPEYVRGACGAHTCGQSCRRSRACPHPCTLLCHPGPCPPCQATISKHCGCGAETRSIICSSKQPQICSRVCNKKINCGVHDCTKDCHEGCCDECCEMVTQVCFCPAASTRSVPCSRASAATQQFACGGGCARVLSCGAHVCRATCHAPPCLPCELLPANVKSCPCGKMMLEEGSRKSCTDRIPLCGNICAKPLPCGPAGDKHFCKVDCHEGPCPVCPEKTLVQCRCGHSSRDVTCADLPELLNNVLCQKKCNKKLSCGRHRCRTVCCAASSHRCAVVCGRTLSCQQHRCEEFCHTGHCAPCAVVSFEELRCPCGASRVLPPVRCGSRAPPCPQVCAVARGCGHAQLHACHVGACPPCVVLTAKRCHGGHEERKTIPCSQEEFSCGLPCGKPLPCGKHTCIKSCHKGPCNTEPCRQPCQEKRPRCGHACAAPCHSGDSEAPRPSSRPSACPSSSPCKAPAAARCPCARKQLSRSCADNTKDLARLSSLAAAKMQEGGSLDISETQKQGSVVVTLECDDECIVEARSRQMALALQIRNPDVSAKLAPRYSDNVRATAARDTAFAISVHDRLTELVHKAKSSKQKTRSHSFPSMNRQKRQFVHEMCEQFGCESIAYDAEPNRNVVATADREKSWLPALSIMEMLARESGKRRVPGPVLRAATSANAPSYASSSSQQSSKASGSGWATLKPANAWAARPQPKPAEPKIDYFDNPPEN